MSEPRCIVCTKTPDEIEEYVDAAQEDYTTPTEWVIANEGTYNKRNGHFWCTVCYIDIGEPLGVAP